jgi:hypothetical protein
VIDYLPYYQLARAHLQCGEADSALHYIEESRDRKTADAGALDDLERRAVEIGNSVSETGPAVDLDELAGLAKEAQETIGKAISASERVNSRRGVNWLTGFFVANQEALTSAHGDITTAQEALNEGTLRQDRNAIKNAEAFASRALVVFTGLESEMAALQPPEATPEPVVTRSAPRPTPTSPPEAVPTRVVTAPSPRPTSPGEEAGGHAEIPPALRKAAADYLAAGYLDVVRGLDPNAFVSARQQAAGYVLRAAAHFAIYCLDGREDDERLDEVRSDIARSLNLEPSLTPDPRFFSPEFIELFQ